jgi:hypothetical protein
MSPVARLRSLGRLHHAPHRLLGVLILAITNHYSQWPDEKVPIAQVSLWLIMENWLIIASILIAHLKLYWGASFLKR